VNGGCGGGGGGGEQFDYYVVVVVVVVIILGLLSHRTIIIFITISKFIFKLTSYMGRGKNYFTFFPQS
jgi:hypothetical protein